MISTEISSRYLDVMLPDQWSKLDAIVDSALQEKGIIETPKMGDSRNEAANLEVIRLINRIEGKSIIVNSQYTHPILDVLADAKLLKTLEQQYSMPRLKILRMQFNSMSTGSFIDTHTDYESDPHYQLTVVIRTTSDFTGGDFLVNDHNAGPLRIQQLPHTVFVFDSSCEHSVEVVTSGLRNSIALFIGSEEA